MVKTTSSANKSKLKVLYLEGDSPVGGKWIDFLDNLDGFEFDISVTDGESCVSNLDSVQFDLIFVSDYTAGVPAQEFFQNIRDRGYELPPVVLVSMRQGEQLVADWHRAGGEGYVYMPNADRQTVVSMFEDVLSDEDDPQQVYRDSVTGLWDSRYLKEELESIAESEAQVGFALIKACAVPVVKKQFGHEAEGQLLKKLSRCLRRTLTHVALRGQYSKNIFWVVFKNDCIQKMPERLSDLFDLFDLLQHWYVMPDRVKTVGGGVIGQLPEQTLSSLRENANRTLQKAASLMGSRFVLGNRGKSEDNKLLSEFSSYFPI